jgi:hypothetical protein
MTGTPQLIITLSPDQSQLQAELPGLNGSRRVCVLPRKNRDFIEACRRILQGLALGKVQIGLDGAPTSQQVRHWERHSMFPDDRCPFCLDEKRVTSQRRQQRLSEHTVGDGSVTVRRVPSRKRGDGLKSATSALQLGL